MPTDLTAAERELAEALCGEPDWRLRSMANLERMKTELIPLPKGMSEGFYKFMAPCCHTTGSGELMMKKGGA